MYFAILVNLSTSFLLSPFFTEKIIISPFYFPHGGRTSSDPNWPLTTLLPQRIVTNIGVWEDSDKHNLFIGKKQTSMKEDWNLENVEVEFNLQMLRLLFFLFPAAFLLNLTQLPLNFEFLFLVCLQSDMFAVGGYESTLLCCISVSDRRSVIVTSFFFSFFST